MALGLNDGRQLSTRLGELYLLPKIYFGPNSLLQNFCLILSVGYDTLKTSNLFFPFLGLGLDNILVVHETEQELLESMAFIFELIQFDKPLFVGLWVLDQFLGWYVLAELNALLLLLLLLFLFLGELRLLDDILGILTPLSGGDGQLGYHGSPEHLIL